MSLSSNFPTSKPSLNLDFANVGALDPRITFTRSSSATYTNSLGLITTAATNVARFDYDPVTLAARGLLIEESRTNLVTYSEQFDNAAWTTQSSAVTANAGVAPDGTTTADKLAADNTSSPHALFNSSGLTLTATIYTWSIFVKAAGNNFANLIAVSPNGVARYAIAVDLTNGTVTQTASSGTATNTSSFVSNYGNGWYRIGISMTASSSAGASYLVVVGIPTGTPTRSSPSLDPLYTGNGTDGIYIWGAQLEAGSFATSYIPTVASTVTRSADVASVNTLSPFYNQTEGSFFVEADAFSTTSFWSSLIEPNLSSNSAGNRFSLGVLSSANSLYAVVSDSVTVSGISSGGLMFAGNAVAKTAFAYKLNDYAISGNGAAVATDTSSAVPAIDRIMLGDDNESRKLNGHLRRIAYYPRRLTNAELQALTA